MMSFMLSSALCNPEMANDAIVKGCLSLQSSQGGLGRHDPSKTKVICVLMG